MLDGFTRNSRIKSGKHVNIRRCLLVDVNDRFTSFARLASLKVADRRIAFEIRTHIGRTRLAISRIRAQLRRRHRPMTPASSAQALSPGQFPSCVHPCILAVS